MRHHTHGPARCLVASLPLVPLLAASATATAAQTGERLDQAQTAYSGGLTVQNKRNVYQTITAGLDGSLTRVDVPLCSVTKNGVAVLTVRATQPPRRASARITFTHSYSDCAWYTFRFSPGLTQSAGEVLRLEVRTVRERSVLWGANAEPGDPYARGEGHWYGHVVNDFAFRTYAS